MTLIAKDNQPGALELYRKVLLASASPPVAFPPVEIDGHLFADGATRQNLVVAGVQGMEDPGPAPYGPGAMYVIHNGRLQHPPKAVTDSFFSLAGTGVGTMMDSNMESILLRAYFGAKVNGYEFLMTQIPVGVDVGNNPLTFEPEKMRNAFAAGVTRGRSQNRWRDRPPNIGDFPPWALKYIGHD